MNITPPPIRSPFNDESGGITGPWSSWTKQVYEILKSVPQSGPTAQRPSILFIGQQYFDTSLGANGKPIFANKAGTGWVTSDGVAA